jgi:hypothetical protein
VEVGHNIAKYLIKLETLNMLIGRKGNANMTEKTATMIAKRLPRLTKLRGCKLLYYSVETCLQKQSNLRMKLLLVKRKDCI